MPDLRAYARQAAEAKHIDGDIFERQIQQESGFNPDAHNDGSGADGIAQIVVRWHPSMAGKTRDPEASLDYAAGLMADHLAYWNGDWALALSSYNAGRQATINGLAGELDGWPYPETVSYVRNILDISEAEARRRLTGAVAMPQTLTYNPDIPAELQVQDWACSIRTATWVLKSLGIAIDAGQLQDEMVPSIVTPADGLKDARGYGIAKILGNHLPSWSDRIHVLESVEFDDVKSIAGSGPIALGGRAWYHWVAVRRANADGTLGIANPAPGYKGVGTTLSRQQFGQLGPFSAVWVNAATAPVEIPTGLYAQPGDVGSGLLAMMAADGTAPAMPSTFLPLGRNPAMIEECQGLNGVIYRWHLPTGQSWRFKAA